MIITLYPNFRALVSILICLTSINLYNTLSAQPVSYRIEQIPLRGELSNFEGTCFLQDNDGFMWFGSKDGLYRYDGINFKVYRNDPLDSNSLSSNYVHWIMEDHEGIIWIGMNSGGGVNRFDKYTETFKQYFAEPDNYLTDRWIEHMIEDREGIFWIGTYLGFSRADKKTKKVKNYAVNRADTSVSQDPHRIWYLFEDADGFIWVQYGMDGLCRFDTESESIVIIPNTPCDLNQIYEDKTGRLWITSWDGLYLFDRKKKLFERYLHESDNPNRLKNQMVKTIMEDVSSNLWIRTYDGIYKYNQDLELMFHWKHSHEYTRTPIYGDITKQMYEDNNGMIWFFTRDGINKIVKTYNYCKVYNQDPANNSFVNCIFLENKDLIWFGALNGLYSFNRITNTFKLHYGTLTDVEAHPYHTYAVHIDQKGILWMGTREGLCKMIKGINGGEQYKIYMFQSGNSSNLKRVPVAHIFEDSERRLWIGMPDQTPCYFKREAECFIQLIDNPEARAKLPRNAYIRHESRTNILWATGMSGVYKIVPPFIEATDHSVMPTDVVHYNPLGEYNATRLNPILTSHLDSNDVLWLGTKLNGLIKLSEKKMTGSDQHEITINFYTTRQGLPGNQIQNILEDDMGNLWLASTGLSKFNTTTETVWNYSLHHLPIGHFRGESAAKSEDGEMFFGTVQGMISFYPDSFHTNQYVAPVKLTGVKVHNNLVLPGDNSILEKSITYTDNIELLYYQNFLTFEFATLNYLESDLNQYKYKLEGLEKDWVEAGYQRLASYSNLNPGKYTFRVLGSNNDGIWNEEGASLGIVIHPPPWRTWWAYVIYGIIIIAIIRWYRNFLITREKLKADLQVEQMEVEKVQELERTKSRFFSNISHEFRTPLTLILGPLDNLITNRPKMKELDWNVFDTMQRNASKLKILINQILDISKLESGQMKLQISEGNISDFLNNIVLSFLSPADSKSIFYKYSVAESSAPLYFDKDKLDKIACNLIGNAFKFTPDGGKISVKLVFLSDEKDNAPEYLELSIRDSGRGIPGDQFDKIFDRFYQMEYLQNNKQEGTGLGLALTKELIEMYRGEIKLQSELGKGSVFTVRLPVSGTHFSSEEIIEPGQEETKESLTLHAEMPEEKIEEQEKLDRMDHLSGWPILLIVEDNPDLRKYIIQCLDTGFSIHEAGDGEEGLDKARELTPDLIISDIMMPGIDGIEMCKKLKTDISTSHIPIIMLTAKGDMGSKIEGLQTGADDYMIKPFDAKELLVRVNNLIEQRKKLRERYRKEMVLGADNLGLPQPDEKFLTRVTEVVNKHISEPEYSVKELAVALGMSRSQLYRKILALTDQSANEFIRNTRLKYAASLFDQGYQNVTEVGLQSGFNSPSYFANCFRKLYGKNPKQYISG